MFVSMHRYRFAPDTSSRFAQVLSFTRLARRICDLVGNAAEETLDNGGRIVAMAAAVRQLYSRLKAYAKVETRPEFLTDLVDVVDEFKRCCIGPRDLMAASAMLEGSFAQKLEELALLMEGYDAICSRGKRDPRDQMNWLLEQMELGSFAREHVFYIDGFPDFTRQHLAILEHLIRESPEVTVSINCDRPDTGLLAFEKAGETAREILKLARQAGVEVKIESVPDGRAVLAPVREKLFQGGIDRGCAGAELGAYHADSPWQECVAAAERILELVEAGDRYRDISVVCTDMAVYRPLVELIFHRFGIPVYIAGTEDILQKSVVSTVLNALEAALSGFEQRATLRYLRSALSPLEPDLCDNVENYAIIWGIRGRKWTESWVNHPEGLSAQWTDGAARRLERLNEARALAIEPLERLRLMFVQARDLGQQVLALYGFLEDIQLARRLRRMAEELDREGDNRSAQILNQLWEILLSALEQMHDVLGQTAWEPEHFTRLLRLLLSQYDVGTIPTVLDAVTVGGVSAMRCQQVRHLLVLGASEGNLPAYGGSSGILSDAERTELRKLGVPLTGGAMEGVAAEFAEIYGCFCAATETITVTCPAGQSAFLYRRLCTMVGLPDGVSLNPGPGPGMTDRWEAGAYLARWREAEAADALYVRPGYEDARNRAEHTLGNVSPEGVRGLYGQKLTLSASQIDRQAECRLSYFLRYGLRAQERKEATVDPAEFGTFVHFVLEHTAKEIMDLGGFHAVSEDQTLDIAHKYAEEYAAERFKDLDSERVTYLFRRNGLELDMVVRELWSELSKSAFEPVAFELNFGPDGDLPAVPISGKRMEARLRGFVDRVDAWKQGSQSFVRVVDYKTGKKDFDYCDVFNGVGLQMLLYLFALEQGGADFLGGRPVSAGVQYFPARFPYLSEDGRLTDEEARSAHLKNAKRKGLILKDEDVVRAMEPGEEITRLSCKRNKNDELVGDVADREQLKQLRRYIFRYLGSLVDEIAAGRVDPNPYTRGSSHSACAFCPYGSVCAGEAEEGRRNYKTMTAQRFWEEIGKEEHDG